jgi:hypothetical protein
VSDVVSPEQIANRLQVDLDAAEDAGNRRGEGGDGQDRSAEPGTALAAGFLPPA